ncbi:MAG TPA: hypothetical protein VLT79_01195, partial [Gemmatimonadales bacterium]|nr:hypothetical protein [Gemmatimonadales bacterium]
LALAVIAALSGGAAARAQLPGMPVWNTPRGGSRFFFAADAGYPDVSSVVSGDVYAARAAAGFQAFTVSATVGVRSQASTVQGSNTEYGGAAAYRIIGGSLIPVAINVQGGAAFWSESGASNQRYTGAVGISVDVPIPYVTMEPWIAPGIRVTRLGTNSASPFQSTEFGWAAGLTFGFGMFGVHLAYDSEKQPSPAPTTGTFGIGVHIDIRPPLGL